MSGIALQSGINIITVTARDAANNPGTDTLTVTYNPPDTPPGDSGSSGPGGDDSKDKNWMKCGYLGIEPLLIIFILIFLRRIGLSRKRQMS
jgi:hypothetical protein